MTIEQRIQWVALPAGAVADGSLLLSVFVAPRLRTDEGVTLALFQDFLDWPSSVATMQFAVEVGGETVPATPVGSPADPDLWTALFPAETPLRPFEFDDYADRPFVTFSTRDVVSSLQQIYTRVAAASPETLPSIVGRRNVEPPVPGLLDLLDDLRAIARGPLTRGVGSTEGRMQRVRRLLDDARAEAAARRRTPGLRGGGLIEPLPADGSVARHFERALLFHSRSSEQPEAMPAGGQHYRASIDFHQMISALGDHPWLMRRLGLVIDLALDPGAVPEASIAAPGTLRVVPTWTSNLPGSIDVLPHTAYAHQTTGGRTWFGAVPRHPDPTAPPGAPPTGLLPLPATAFRLEQVDVDGAALKALNLTATLNAIAARPDPAGKPLHEPDEMGIPALRTGGLSLAEAGRAASLQALFAGHIDQNDAIEHAAPVTFFAEDLVRGYRIDVFDVTGGAWRSLHQRVVTAAAERVPDITPPAPDEGFLQLSLVGAATAPEAAPDSDGELYVHENLVTWDGWSLSAPRPGKAISRDPRAPASDEPATQPSHVTNDPFTAMGLSIETRAATGTLPRLRFGRGYRVRVRTVDLAGNGPSLADADAIVADAGTATPVLPAADVMPYLRFEPVAAPAIVPAQRFGEGASLQRLVVRSNAELDPEAYATVFNGSELVTTGGHPGYAGIDVRHFAAPKCSFDMAERHGKFDPVIGADGAPPSAERLAEIAAAYEIARREKGSFDDPSLPTAELVELSADVANPQRYMIHHEEQLELPYLPDPLAAGAIFFGLPGQPAEEPLIIGFEGPSWYQAQPFRLRLAGGEGAPAWDPATRILSVFLPQATTVSASVASLFGGDLGQMGLLRWCEQVLPAADLDRVVRAAKANRCWLLTPWTDLELVHAVQQPLQTPEWIAFDVGRGFGQASADIYGELALHAPSTEKIDLVAEWTEMVDDIALPGPEQRQAHTEIFELSIKTAATGRTDGDSHEFPYSLRDGKVLTFFTARAEQVNPPAPLRHQLGDTRYRRIRYQAIATTAFREDFPTQWSQQPDLLSRASAAQEVDVLSSTPPVTPKLLYVIPTQRWTTADTETSSVRQRHGGGLRLYLDRPWFSSGDGELLGIVIGGALTSPKAEDYPFMTLLGADPIRGGAALEFAKVKSFRNPTLVTAALELLELRRRFTIVAYRPDYDAGTRRWFCDIELDTGQAYLPFVRLAIVRYQPRSLPGCEVSRIVLADIVQTLPDRTLTVTRTDAELEVAVAGVSYTAIRGVGAVRTDQPVLARLVALLEERDPAIADPLLGWIAVSGTDIVLTPAFDGENCTWTGRLPLPPTSGLARRLRVIEQDVLAVDEQTAADGLGTRTIYSDVLELP